MNVYADFKNLPYEESGFPLLFSSRYLDYQKSLGFLVYVIGDDDGNYIPISVHKKYGFKRGKVLYTPLNATKEIGDEAERKFLDELMQFLKEESIADVLYPPMHICTFHSLPSFGLASKMGIMRVPLHPKTETEVFSGFQPQYRNIIRKAEKDNVEILFGQDCITDFYALYHDTIEREKSLADSETSIRLLAEHLGENHFQCGVAYVDKKPQAALFNMYNVVEAYHFYSGTASVSLHQGALRLLHWRAITQLLQQKVRSYCLGGVRPGPIEGSKYERIINFKKRFGAEVDQGYHFILPITAKYQLYKRLLRIYFQLRGLKPEEDTMLYEKISKA